MNKNNTLMTSGTIWKELLYFSIPLVLGNLFQQFYNIADSVIVGRVVGSNALAAVGASGTIINLLIGFCIGASAGSSVIISQHYGAQENDKVKKAVNTTVAVSVAAGLILAVVGFFFTPFILNVMKTPAEVFDDAEGYLRYFFIGCVFAVIYNMCAGILNAVGNSKRSLIYLIVAACTNVVLDILFIAVFKMGVVGAAIATDLAQFVSCILIIRFLVKTDMPYGIRPRDVKFYKGYLSRIIKIGFPTGVQNIVVALSNVVVQSAINSFGATVMASFAAFNKADGFLLLPVLSIGIAASTFVGQNYGAKQHHRMNDGFRVSLRMGFFYAVIAGMLMLVVGRYIFMIFTEDQGVVEVGVFMMRCMYPFYGLLAIFNIAGGALKGVGKTMEVMLISLFSMCVVRILWVFVCLTMVHNLLFLMLIYPATWALCSVMMIVYMKKSRWDKIEGEEIICD